MKNTVSSRSQTEKNTEIKSLEDKIQAYKQKLDDLYVGDVSQIDCRFSSPSSDFDKSLVKGRVIRLFSIKEDKYARALEEIAGGRLYNVVVETEAIATVMLKQRCFRGRQTLIPNNKINVREIPQEIIDYVTKVTDGKAVFAMNLIKYNLALEPSMKFVFGNAFVCEDQETAKKVTYDPRVRTVCVTLDGDVYSPHGTL